jgi:uncharacterized membrane protein
VRGEVIGFDPDTNTGAIIGHDGNRYGFVRLDWRGLAAPTPGAAVDFLPAGGNASEIYAAPARRELPEAATAQLVYVLYLVSLAVGITGIVGVIMAYVNRTDAPDWLKTHYRLQIRTFWIGLLYGVLGLLTVILLIGFFVLAFLLIWWIVRCAKGLKYLGRGEPYPKPATWLW